MITDVLALTDRQAQFQPVDAAQRQVEGHRRLAAAQAGLPQHAAIACQGGDAIALRGDLVADADLGAQAGVATLQPPREQRRGVHHQTLAVPDAAQQQRTAAQRLVANVRPDDTEMALLAHLGRTQVGQVDAASTLDAQALADKRSEIDSDLWRSRKHDGARTQQQIEGRRGRITDQAQTRTDNATGGVDQTRGAHVAHRQQQRLGIESGLQTQPAVGDTQQPATQHPAGDGQGIIRAHGRQFGTAPTDDGFQRQLQSAHRALDHQAIAAGGRQGTGGQPTAIDQQDAECAGRPGERGPIEDHAVEIGQRQGQSVEANAVREYFQAAAVLAPIEPDGGGGGQGHGKEKKHNSTHGGTLSPRWKMQPACGRWDMRRILPALAATVSLAAADPVPAAFLPSDAPVAASAPDLPRARSRWAETPYARLAATAWAGMLVAEWSNRLEASAPGTTQVLGSLRSAAIAMPADGVIVAVQGDAVLLRQALTLLLPTAVPGEPPRWSGATGHAALHGDVAVCALGGTALPTPTEPPVVTEAGEADVVLHLGAKAWSVPLAATLRLDPLGLRERLVVPSTVESRALATTTTRWADPGELRALPASTLWAATWTSDAAALRPLLDRLAAQPGLAGSERTLADFGLPGLVETLRACDGPATVWMGEGLPFPSATLALGLSEAVAQRWVAALGDRLGLVPVPTGGRAGFVGLLPIAVGWIDGRLIITSDPLGLDVWRQRKPGFAELPPIRTALDALPPRLLVLGAGRGGASWSALAQLTVPVFTAMGAPQAVSLPQDLRDLGGHGRWRMELRPDGTLVSEALGLAGGPLTAAVLGGLGVRATLWLQEQQRRERPVAPPQVQKVF